MNFQNRKMFSGFRKSTLAFSAAIALAASCSGSDEGLSLGEGEVIELHGQELTTTGGLVADAHVRQAAPTTNYGTSATLNSDSADGGGAVHAYMRFSIGN